MAIVYIHKIKDTDIVFYVGISHKNDSDRPYQVADYQRNNKLWQEIYLEYGRDVEIIKKVPTWDDACDLETWLIKSYGRLDLNTGYLVNKTDGGDGFIGPYTAERKQNLDIRYKKDEYKSGFNKINFKDAVKIRKDYFYNIRNIKELSLDYNLSEVTIKEIFKNYTWESNSYEALYLKYNFNTRKNELFIEEVLYPNLDIFYIEDNTEEIENIKKINLIINSILKNEFNSFEKKVIKLYFGIDYENSYNTEDIGNMLNMSKVYISSTIKRIIRLLRHSSFSKKLKKYL